MSKGTEAKARVMLVEDHGIVRHGLAMLINAQADTEVCGEADNVDTAISMIREENMPDIVLIDISLQGLSGFELIKHLKARFPSLLMLVVSMHDETLYAQRALQAGAHGYVMKQEAAHTILAAIRNILKGKIHLSERMNASILKRIAAGETELLPPGARLTPSEFEILQLISAGYGSQEISTLLNRSIKTIESHRANIRNKLGLKDGAALIRFATQWKMGNHSSSITPHKPAS